MKNKNTRFYPFLFCAPPVWNILGLKILSSNELSYSGLTMQNKRHDLKSQFRTRSRFQNRFRTDCYIYMLYLQWEWEWEFMFCFLMCTGSLFLPCTCTMFCTHLHYNKDLCVWFDIKLHKLSSELDHLLSSEQHESTWGPGCNRTDSHSPL